MAPPPPHGVQAVGEENQAEKKGREREENREEGKGRGKGKREETEGKEIKLVTKKSLHDARLAIFLNYVLLGHLKA